MKTKEELVSLGIDGFKADEIMLLQEKMMERAVKFQFRKKDGSIRDAVGTLRQNLMLQVDGTMWTPKGESKPEPISVVRFFDVVNGAWRCFSCVDFIAITEG
jgi:hypothetical protein